MYSSIRKKKCKGECGRYPVLGLGGYCYKCCPPEIKEKAGTKHKVAQKNKNARNKCRSLNNSIQVKVDNTAAELNRWFDDCRKEMTGKCANCGGDTKKYDDKYFRYSISHLLPKAYFGSIKTHPDNWIELCYFGNGCHPQMDNKLLDLIDMNCFDQIVTKFVKIYPAIAPNEKRRIPEVLLQYIETEK